MLLGGFLILSHSPKLRKDERKQGKQKKKKISLFHCLLSLQTYTQPFKSLFSVVYFNPSTKRKCRLLDWNLSSIPAREMKILYYFVTTSSRDLPSSLLFLLLWITTNVPSSAPISASSSLIRGSAQSEPVPPPKPPLSRPTPPAMFSPPTPFSWSSHRRWIQRNWWIPFHFIFLFDGLIWSHDTRL